VSTLSNKSLKEDDFIKSEKRSFSISVRELVEFSLRTGDLEKDSGFFAPMRALEGIRGHQKIQRSRPAGYQSEVSIQHLIQTSSFTLTIQGRIDGLLPGTPLLLEEIKTLARAWEEEDPLHWAQLKIYGAIFCEQNNLEEIALQLTYLQLHDGKIHEFCKTFKRTDLLDFLNQALSHYIEWLNSYCEWLKIRTHSIQKMAFPFSYRSGQKLFTNAVEESISKRYNLFVEAPTGMGKTISTLFPSIQALGRNSVENIFYLTAKTVGRTVAEKTLSELRETGLHIRSITLTAKEKICSKKNGPCDSQNCPLAKGHYDRLREARKELFRSEAFTRNKIEELAEKHQLCPYALSRELARWADIVICDYNYVFDPTVYLRDFFTNPRGEYIFLIDEAHNLPDRAREMFSADLDEMEIRQLLRELGSRLPKIKKLLQQLLNSISFENELGELFTDENSRLPITPTVPDQIVALIKHFLQETGEWLSKNEETSYRTALLEFYFRASHFFFISELFDERFVTMHEEFQKSRRVRLFCLDPSLQIRQALERARTSIFFSATLTPVDFFKTIIGANEKDKILNLSSPFPTENLGVLVADFVSTTFQKRASSYQLVAEIISRAIQSKKGNYLVFFPSYDYLKNVVNAFEKIDPSVKTLVQTSNMSENAREQFLAHFQSDRADTLVGFSVMGGIFGEGIDLMGDRLVGAIIVGVGLPQISPERETLKNYYLEHELPGFDFAYTFPGMNRVLQAVGRVIRSEEDRGIALLIDSRFSEFRYRSLFPEWWRPIVVKNTNGISESTRKFWTRDLVQDSD
jgi:DNA excision repair protein ERCC-2